MGSPPPWSVSSRHPLRAGRTHQRRPSGGGNGCTLYSPAPSPAAGAPAYNNCPLCTPGVRSLAAGWWAVPALGKWCHGPGCAGIQGEFVQLLHQATPGCPLLQVDLRQLHDLGEAYGCGAHGPRPRVEAYLLETLEDEGQCLDDGATALWEQPWGPHAVHGQRAEAGSRDQLNAANDALGEGVNRGLEGLLGQTMLRVWHHR